MPRGGRGKLRPRDTPRQAHPKQLIQGKPEPYYETPYGAAYVGDSLEWMERVRRHSVRLVMTSPPFALTKQKEYGTQIKNHESLTPEKYSEWFMPFAEQIYDILTPDGSLVVHLGGSWEKGKPLKSLYPFQLAVDLPKRTGFRFAQDFNRINKARLPTPAQWVTIKRIRLKDAVDPVFWFCKQDDIKTRASNRRVPKPYSDSMKRLLKKQTYNSGIRPSGHRISATSFLTRHRGAIPPNYLVISGTESSSAYLRYTSPKVFNIERNPARYPVELASFFVQFLTSRGDLVLDPFAGSNSTGEAAQKIGRRWLAFDIHRPYLEGSRFRFFTPRELGLAIPFQQR